jgi:hypothetical protein
MTSTRRGGIGENSRDAFSRQETGRVVRIKDDRKTSRRRDASTVARRRYDAPHHAFLTKAAAAFAGFLCP